MLVCGDGDAVVVCVPVVLPWLLCGAVVDALVLGVDATAGVGGVVRRRAMAVVLVVGACCCVR